MAIVFASNAGDLIAATVILVSLCVFYVNRKYAYWQRRSIAYIPPQFPFGNFKEKILQRKSIANLTAELYATNNAPIVGLWTLLRPTLLVRDPQVIRHILIKDFASFADRGTYCDEELDPLSAHLFALPGEKWRPLRHKLSPTFTSGKLKAMFSTIVACGAPLTRHMTAQADTGSVVEVRELLAQYTTNIIASVAFGLDIDCIGDPNTEFRRFGRQVFAPTFLNGVRFTIAFFFPSLMRLLRLKAIDKEVEEFFLSVVRQNLRLRESGGVTRKDFFQLLVQLRNGGLEADGVWETQITKGDEKAKQLNVEQCAAQSFVFYLAGFETSSTTSSFALYEMAKNPECQRRAQAEIDEVLQRHGGAVTYESVAEMKYLESCIDETLRKYPPVPILNRVCSTTWTVPNSGGTTIEPGTDVIIPVYALHHDPQYYPNPTQFDPERFGAEQMADQSTAAQRPYLPFGDGQRNCIGLRLGKLQTKVGLIAMLQRYDYELAGSSKLPITMEANSIFLNPVGGINLRVSHRK